MGCGSCGGGGRGREVTVSAAGSTFRTGEQNVKWRHTTPGSGHTDYNTQDEADGARAVIGGTVNKVDQATGRVLDS